MSLISPERLTEQPTLVRLWVHECDRTFKDRLVNEADAEWFRVNLQKTFMGVAKTVTDKTVQSVFREPLPEDPLVYANFMEMVPEDRVYEEVTDAAKAKKTLETYLEQYNDLYPKKPMELVVFQQVAAMGRAGGAIRTLTLFFFAMASTL